MAQLMASKAKAKGKGAGDNAIKCAAGCGRVGSKTCAGCKQVRATTTRLAFERGSGAFAKLTCFIYSCPIIEVVSVCVERDACASEARLPHHKPRPAAGAMQASG
jgi:hypothetical protein